jgi:hypothetical protein
MPQIDRPFDAADDDHESVEGRYEHDDGVLRNVWGMRVDGKSYCSRVAFDEDGNPVYPQGPTVFDRLQP